MKACVLLGIVVICLAWYSYASETSLHEVERLHTAEILLYTVPIGMQKDIEKKLYKFQTTTKNERERFCIQYLLYQLQLIANQSTTPSTNT